MDGTKLCDPEFRKSLIEGGEAAVAASTDPMIVAARRTDALTREYQRWQRDEFASVLIQAGEKLGKARFLVYGKDVYPDATFTLLSGQKVTTADLKGKVYLVNFWATNCDTCMKEMPQMVDTYNRFKGKGLEFVAVAMKYDAPMYVANYTETRRLPFKVAMDDGSAAEQFGNVQLTPTTFVIGRDGKILKRYVGEPSFQELDALLDKELGSA